MPRLFLLAALVCLASGATAQTLNLFTACSEGEATRVCGYNTSTTGPPTVFTPPQAQIAQLNYMAVASGQLATLIRVFEGGQFVGSDLIISDIDGSSAQVVRRISPEFVPTQRFSLSPDLTRIAYVANVNNAAGIRIYDFVAGTTSVPLASGVSSSADAPAWSPDGDELIVTLSPNPGLPDEAQPLAIVSADGSGTPRVLSMPLSGYSDVNASWSADGVSVAFIRVRRIAPSGTNIEFVSVGGQPLSGQARPAVPEGGSRLFTDVQWVGSSVAVLSTLNGVVEIAIGTGPAAVTISSVGPGGGPNTVGSFRLLDGLSSRGLVVNVTSDANDTDLNDGLCDSDASMPNEQCSLRAAIANGNRRVERDSISFDIPGTGPHVITLSGSLPTSTQPLVIDATTQPGYSGVPLVRLRGSGTAKGLVMGGRDSVVRGLSIGNLAAEAIKIQGGGGSRVEACWIGLASDGSTAVANGGGIVIDGSPNNVIGSPEASRLNIIANSRGFGIEIKGTGATGNRVIKNVIGMTVAGSTLAANDSAAVRVSGGAMNTVIGTPTDGNRIAGSIGIEIEDRGASGGSPDGTTVQGNVLGLTLDGSATLGEMANGIVARGPSITRGVTGLKIGGLEAAEGNVIVASFGVAVLGARSSGAVVGNNRLGLKGDGTLARTDTVGIGIFLVRADQTQIAGNVVGGYGFGIALASNENVLIGNNIGVDPTGEENRPNLIGLFIPGAYVGNTGTLDVGDRNIVGAQPFPNVISGNVLGVLVGSTLDLSGSRPEKASGAEIRRHVAGLRSKASGSEGPADANVIAFNRIGTNAAGTRQIGNGRLPEGETEATTGGLFVSHGTGNRVLGNLISGNGAGMEVGGNADVTAFGTIVAGNVIGGSMTPGETIPNQSGGIEIERAQGTRVIAAPLVEGGEPVGNLFVGNGKGGVNVIGGSDTRIRGSSFEGNDGPSISADFLAFPTFGPNELFATATPGAASFRVRPVRAGEIDVFVSPDCTDGNADGTYLLTVPATEDQFQTISIPYSRLGGSQSAAMALYLAMTQTDIEDTRTTSRFSTCIRITDPADVAEATVASGETGVVLNEPDVEVEITANGAPLARGESGTTARGRSASGGGGTLAASVYREQIVPQPGPFEGSATSASGATVTPDAVSSNRHWTLRASGLENVTYSVCLETDGVGGIADASQLVVLHRADAGEPWTPYDSSLDGTRLCANGLTAWGDLGIGGDALVNPVPSEPEPLAPASLAVRAFPNPASTSMTVEVATPEAGVAQVEVFDALGRRVAVLHNGPLTAETHAFAMDASRLPAGVYVVRVMTPEAEQVRRVTVAR